MGPVSREAVCMALGHLIDEAQQQRAVLRRIEQLLEQRAENDSEDLIQVNKRVTELEREVRGHGTAPNPANQ